MDKTNDNKPKFDKYSVRPIFPKKAVVTGGMPYGNKKLHFGHVGGNLVFADVYARFMRDRIGKDNVIFVSGTDCYGSPIAESHRKLCEEGLFSGTLSQYAEMNHNSHKATLKAYDIEPNLFAASALGRAGEIHKEVSDRFIRKLYQNGQLTKITTSQFFDEKRNLFLNGRQVLGKCPVEGCQSEKGYADECDLGHQYMPENLINPVSTLSGETPIMKDVTNWFFKLTDWREELTEYTERIKRQKNVRPLVTKTTEEFLKKPVIYIKNDFLEAYENCKNEIPPHNFISEPKKTSFTIEFEELSLCDKAAKVLHENNIRYRTGKTLVPHRLTGNIEWGVPAPSLEGETDLTIWVWPESLWAPISFTETYLESIGKDRELWKDFWCKKDSQVYQFIGSDNLYFYGVAEMGMFLAQMSDGKGVSDPPEGELQLPIICANNHILFLDKKASSSGSVKPPMADDLLNYYTAEQLRMHFLGLGLGQRSVSFQPKPYNPEAKPEDTDPVLKDGFLLSNVFNRIIRTCFYTTQKYFDGVLPVGEIDADVLENARKAILDYERFMYRFEFHQATYVLDTYIRKASKYMAAKLSESDKKDDNDLRYHTLVNVFHMIRTASVLLHPMVPKGTMLILEYLELTDCDDKFFSWDYIFEPLSFFTENKQHKLKFLPPRTDFFTRHPSQFTDNTEENEEI